MHSPSKGVPGGRTMEKELKFPLHLQLFADTGNGEDEDDILDDEDFDDDEANGGDDDEVEEETDSEDQHDDEEESETDSKKKKKGQSQEENARQAKLRRQKERQKREEEIRRAAYEQGKLDSVKTNPYTNKPIEDAYDLRIYEIQKKIQERGGDPIADLALELASIERETAKRKKESEEEGARTEELAKKHLSDFQAKYKDVNTSELINDESFLDYAGDRLGKVDLITLYEGYLKLTKAIIARSESDEKKRKMEEAAKKRGTSPSSGGESSKGSKPYSQLSKKERIAELKRQGLIN